MAEENFNDNENAETKVEAADSSEVAMKVPKGEPLKIDMTRTEYDRVKKEYLEDKKNPKKQKKKSFNSFFKFGKRQAMEKSTKKNDEILVFLLNLKKQIEGPILTKIYGGNFLVIRNHVYRFNPDRVFGFSKYKAVIAREYDRELVGVDDYEELVMTDFTSEHPGRRVNIDDPVLIKALINAKLSEKPQNKMSMNWIWIVLLIVGIIAAFFIFGKKAPAKATGIVTPPTVAT